jgi:phenylalanyl-tRNA synthetase alpha chain
MPDTPESPHTQRVSAKVELSELRAAFDAQLSSASTASALKALHDAFLGRKSGSVTAALKGLGALAPDQRKAAGAQINALKTYIETTLAEQQAALAAMRRPAGAVDVTLPGRALPLGRIHPLMQVRRQVEDIFTRMGYEILEGPEVEDDFHNFEALNIPKDHPARQMQDTFYLPAKPDGSQMVLRTHTSPVQIRTMQSEKPPLRVICPGRTYRVDSDMTHSPMFHQVEGLVIDESTHMGHLKGCLQDFCRAFFGIDDLKLRFRPSYFPFTEPSAEVDIGCDRSGGELKFGQGNDWLEILGCGMVHPKVLKNCGLDPEKYQGFAFGMGIERIAMLKYGIPDLRTFYDADLRWLKHYGFLPLDVPSVVGGLTR